MKINLEGVGCGMDCSVSVQDITAGLKCALHGDTLHATRQRVHWLASERAASKLDASITRRNKSAGQLPPNTAGSHLISQT
jgi:hypothetical protein